MCLYLILTNLLRVKLCFFLEPDIIEERVDQINEKISFTQLPTTTQPPLMYSPYTPQESTESYPSQNNVDLPKDNFDNHKYTKDDYTNHIQPTNYKTPSSEYDQDYYSLNEVALGSELHESTYNDENDTHEPIDRIGTEYEYYDYDYEDQDSKETRVKDEETEKDDDEDDYEIYYYYTYEYIDPEDLKTQYEKLPKPSYQTSSNTTLLSDNQGLTAK